MEHRIIMALGDVKAVTFECLNPKCSTRVSVSPEMGQIPKQCPSCGVSWMTGAQTSQQSDTSQAKNFVTALAQLRVLAAQTAGSISLPFRIHLEFVEEALPLG
jgi:hypothetical protein